MRKINFIHLNYIKITKFIVRVVIEIKLMFRRFQMNQK